MTRLQRLLHQDRRTVLVVSHRACWKRASENAIEGIRRCIADGIDMVEIDVRTTRDGVLVLMHDETVDRTTDGHGAIADLSWAQVRRLRLRDRGGGARALPTERRVPTFAQALGAVRGLVLMNIDVKAASLERIIDEVARARATRDVVLNVPVDVDAIVVGRAEALGIAVQPVFFEPRPPASSTAALDHVAALRPIAIQLIFTSPSIIEAARARANDTRLFVNTMTRDIATGAPMNLSGPFLDERALSDPDAVWGALIARGVTMIQTDEPWRLKTWLASRHKRSP